MITRRTCPGVGGYDSTTSRYHGTSRDGTLIKLLLTSSGISNQSISNALVELLGKPIAESSALFIPTGIYPFPGGVEMAWKAICGKARSPLCELGWKSLGVLELTALPTIRDENWVSMVREADAMLVWGGDVLYLTHWMRRSGLADLLPSLSESVYVGVSAGSIVLTPYNCDAEFDLEFVPEGSDMALGAERALGLVDFTLYPHLGHPDMPDTTLANIEQWASGIPVRTYAIDDETAIKVVDGTVEVVSEGNWKLLNP
jgi:dipeptidase E